MALMFQRLARNFIKNGYFPTDEVTIARVLAALVPVSEGPIRIFDPCAGEGVALAEIKMALGSERTEAHAVEYDRERAWHAKGLLDRCIHGDFQDCIVGRKQYGLLWLNPPYGDMVTDSAGVGDMQKRQRFEKLFWRLSIHTLQPAGVLVWIVPHYVFDAELSGWIAGALERVSVYAAPVQTYKQIVVIGQRAQSPKAVAKTRQMLEAIGKGDVVPPELPQVWLDTPYTVPTVTQPEAVLYHTRLDAEQLAAEVERHPGLWPTFGMRFRAMTSAPRRPACKLSDWHLALALAAGQVAGVVKADRTGRVFVVKGDTHKEKTWRTEVKEIGVGKKLETQVSRIATDRFVPVIRALDFTPGSATFGKVLIVK